MDILNFLDIPIDFENDILSRAKKQIDLGNNLSNISTIFSNLSNNMNSIFTELNQLNEIVTQIKYPVLH